MAREALSIGDKIMSENYFQHADHFSRILSEQENFKRAKNSHKTSIENNQVTSINEDKKIEEDNVKDTSIKLQSETN